MAGPSSSSEDEGGSHSGSSGDEAPKLPQKVLCPLPWWGRCSGRKTWVCCGTPDSPSLSSARTHTHTHAAFPSQRPQTKTKLPQAAGPSSPQRPKTPEETKPASPGPQEDTDSEGEQSGQNLREEGLGAWTLGSEGGKGF